MNKGISYPGHKYQLDYIKNTKDWLAVIAGL